MQYREKKAFKKGLGPSGFLYHAFAGSCPDRDFLLYPHLRDHARV